MRSRGSHTGYIPSGINLARLAPGSTCGLIQRSAGPWHASQPTPSPRTKPLVRRAGGALWAARLSHQRWALQTALPEVQRLMDRDRIYPAFRLLRQAEQYVPQHPDVARLLAQLATPSERLRASSGSGGGAASAGASARKSVRISARSTA